MSTARKEAPASSRGNYALPRKDDAEPDQLSDGTDEHSSLLTPRASQDADLSSAQQRLLTVAEGTCGDVAGTDGEGEQQAKSSLYLFLLTLCMFGLQIAWSVEFAYGSPYLLSLGISKSLLAIVWIAGPLSGTLVQPYVGIQSDRCRSRFGKRRPFIVGGALATVSSFIALAWAKEIVGGILGIFGVSSDSSAVSTTAIVLAVLLVYVLDFSINVIQAGIRAFIVDSVPSRQQDSANAWAARTSGIGNIIGYLFGYTDLRKYFGFIGDTQFKILCVFAALAMITTVAVCCLSVKERDARGDARSDGGTGLLSFFRTLAHSARRLPAQIKRICAVQFFAWIGWFPFLFYSTTYVGQIYAEPFFSREPDMSKEEIEEVWQRGTRVATFAMFIFAIVSFLASVFLPLIIVQQYEPRKRKAAEQSNDTEAELETPLTRHSNGTTHAHSPFSRTSTDDLSRAQSPTKWISKLTQRLPSVRVPGFTLRLAWLFSHLMFALLTWLTLFVRTTTSASVLIAFIGIPWTMTNWAPFALIATEISKRDDARHRRIRSQRQSRSTDLENDAGDGDEDDAEEGPTDQAGVVLGIHNVAIAAPQVIATLISSVVFRALQKPRGSTGDDSVAWMLRFGGVCALVAAWLTRRVGKDDAK